MSSAHNPGQLPHCIDLITIICEKQTENSPLSEDGRFLALFLPYASTHVKGRAELSVAHAGYSRLTTSAQAAEASVWMMANGQRGYSLDGR